MIEKCIFLAILLLMGVVYKGKVEKTVSFSMFFLTLITFMLN